MYHLDKFGKRSSSGKLFNRSKSLLLGAAFAATTLGIVSIALPVQAGSQVVQIAQKMTNLRKSKKHWIEINLATQRLIAWEGGEKVYEAVISSGKSATPTRTGVFNVQSKHISQRMRGRDYDIPNVPYTMFYQGNYAIHGAFWHNNFGTPVSHGCTNLQVDDAKWVFEWASVGTPVVVHN